MVWFQCESCGDNLKKPKLQTHFQQCAARSLSCIDCGVVFDQQSVQGHTSCVTEEVRYGPRDAFRQALANSSDGAKEPSAKGGETLELTIGLSTRPPWECSLCRVKCTSQETLQGHAQGKKHRAKARAAAKAQAEKEAPGRGAAGDAHDKKVQVGLSTGNEVNELVAGIETKKVDDDMRGKEGEAASGGVGADAEGKKEGGKKRKERSGEEEATMERAKGDGAEKKRGKKQKKEALQEAEEVKVAEAIDAAMQDHTKKAKKKNKKPKAEEGADTHEGLEAEKPDGTEDYQGREKDAVPNGGEPTGIERKQSKRQKKGSKIEGAEENGVLGKAASLGDGGTQKNGKKGKAGRVLDEKQYWEALAEEGRKKKQEESPAQERLDVKSGQSQPNAEDEERSEKKDRKRQREASGPAAEGETNGAKRKKGKKRGPKHDSQVETGGLEASASGVDGREEESGSGNGVGPDAGPETEVAPVVGIKPGKLRKMIKKALQEADNHSLSLKKLLKTVGSQQAVTGEVPKEALREQILLQVTKTSGIQLTGERVSLKMGE